MMPAPKGLEYWIDSPNGPTILENAPDWAKKEFKQYMNQMSDKPNDDRKSVER